MVVEAVGNQLGTCLPLAARQGKIALFGLNDQAQPPVDLISKNAVLGNQILVAEEQFLVHRLGDVRQQAFPIHCPSTQLLVFDEAEVEVSTRKLRIQVLWSRGAAQTPTPQRVLVF